MKVINFGSLNIDLVYHVREFARPGETISATGFARFAGGKGLNQSVALARAGAEVFHAGAVGADGGFLLDVLRESGADCSAVAVDPEVPTGHAVIQVADSGENLIVLYPGANHRITPELTERALANAEVGDILLLQNEISSIPGIMRAASKRGMRIFFNPAPMTSAVAEYPLELVDTLIVNETEWEAVAGCQLPSALNILKTLGARGAVYNDDIRVPADHVDRVVDTTAAGDTFIGYFIAELLRGAGVSAAMTTAAAASAWCIQRPGASPSIPWRKDLA
jgi:ribokinase